MEETITPEVPSEEQPKTATPKQKQDKESKADKERLFLQFMKQKGGVATRTDIVEKFGKAAGPWCYSLEKKGLIRRKPDVKPRTFELVK
jgi:hypothetical protein